MSTMRPGLVREGETLIEHRTAVGRGVLGGWIYYCAADGYSDEAYRTKTAARDAAAAHELTTASCDNRLTED